MPLSQEQLRSLRTEAARYARMAENHLFALAPSMEDSFEITGVFEFFGENEFASREAANLRDQRHKDTLHTIKILQGIERGALEVDPASVAPGETVRSGGNGIPDFITSVDFKRLLNHGYTLKPAHMGIPSPEVMLFVAKNREALMDLYLDRVASENPNVTGHSRELMLTKAKLEIVGCAKGQSSRSAVG